MSTQVQFRRGTSGETAVFTGAVGEVTVDTTKNICVVHNGSTVGGTPLLREDGFNMALWDGTLGSCALKFATDVDTGLIHPGANQLSFVTGGVARIAIDSTGVVSFNSDVIFSSRLTVPPGLVTDPGLNFVGDSNTGIYAPAADQIGFVTNGTERFKITNAGLVFNSAIAAPSGSVGTPTFTFIGDTNTGIYNPAADEIGFVTNGTERFKVTNTGLLFNAPIAAPLGTVSAPGLTFTGDLNTGIYSPTANQIGLTTDGVERIRIDASGNIGINNSSPAYTLDISGTVRSSTGRFNTVVLPGSTSGTTTVQSSAIAASTVITFPATTGTVITTGDTGTVTSTMIANGTIVDADINASAAISLSKLATGALPTSITITSSNIVDGTIIDADINANAEIAVSKLADGAARQLLQTDAAGTGVEWTSNIDVPGTLDVTGVATFDSSVTIAGDLTVNGTTTNINTQNLIVEDKNIILGDVATPTDLTADGGGITLKGTTDKTINWIDATDAWTLSEHVNIANGKEYRINGTKVLDATSLGSSVLITSANITNGTIVDADINASAAIAGTKISPNFGSQTIQTTGVISAAAGSAAAPSIAFTGDLNTGIYSPGADQVAISTNGTGRLFINATGQVGIGGSPSSDFEITSALPIARLRDTTDNSYGEILNNNGALSIRADEGNVASASYIDIRVDGSERARFTSDGRLGLGTSSPSYPLHVANGAVGITSFSNSIDGAGEVGLLLRGTSGSHNTSLLFSSSNTNFRTRQYFNVLDGSLKWDTSSDGAVFSERMRLDSSGRLGLGTSSPQTSLHVAKDSNAVSSQPFGDFQNNGQAFITGATNPNKRLALGVDTTLTNMVGVIQAMEAGIIARPLALNPSGGNVGIGIASPAVALHVVGQGRFDHTAVNAVEYLRGGTVVGDIGGTSGGAAFSIRSATSTPITFNIATSEAARIDSSSRLLVGTSSAFGQGLFQVNNNISIGSYFASAFSNGIYFVKSRSATAGQFTVVQSGDELGQLLFQGTDGAANITAASILAAVDGTPGANDMPGRLVFATTADGASSPTERMRINSAGNVGIGTNPGVPLDVAGAIRSISGTIDARLQAGYSGAVGIGAQSNDAVLFIQNATERARIDSSGRLLVGLSSVYTVESFNRHGYFAPTAGDTNNQVVIGACGTAGFPALWFTKTRGASVSTQTILQNADNLGQIGFFGSDGVDYNNSGAKIFCQVEGTPTADAIPSKLVFSTAGTTAGVGPVERLKIDSTGTATFTSAAAAPPLIAKVSTSEVARIDSSGRLLVGTSTARSNYSAYGAALLQAEGANSDGARAFSFTYGKADAGDPIISLGKHRSNSVGGVTVVNDGDGIGQVVFAGSDGTNFVTGATIRAQVDGTPGANDMPGRLVFSTTADGASSPTERMRITNVGRVGIGTQGPASLCSVEGGNIALQSPGSSLGVRTTERLFLRSDLGSTNGMAAIGMNGTGTNGFLGEIKFYTGLSDVFNTSLSERARIDSSGRLLVGAPTSYNSQGGRTPIIQFTGTDFSSANLGLNRWSADNQSFDIQFSKSRGAVGTHAVVSSNDGLGAIAFSGSDGSSFIPAALIFCNVDGTPGTNDMPGRLVFSTTADGASSPTERMRISSSGNVGIGTTSPGYALDVASADTTAGIGYALRLRQNATAGAAALQFTDNTATTQYGYIACDSSSNLKFTTGLNERARIDSSGRLLVGTSTARSPISGLASPLQVEGTTIGTAGISVTRSSNDADGPSIWIAKNRGGLGTNTTVVNGDELGAINFTGNEGSNQRQGASIRAYVDGVVSGGGAADMPGRLVFSTTADGASSPTERMRIRADGMTAISGDFITGASATKAQIQAASVDGKMIDVTTGAGQLFSARNSTSSVNHFVFYNPNGAVGTIATSASATAYNTSSDYRLKENVVPLTGAIDRLNQLQVHRFNFIADPDKTVDGFIAHEAQAVVPECVTGTKDEVDDDGNPVYQGIDQSKIVPLVVAALQEALAEIETLKARLAEAGIS